MARIKDVAELAGVNRSTVSRIINGEGKFREETKMKVEQAMAELNYRPSAIARSLATSSSNMVGLLVTYYTGGFFGEMMEKVQGELDSHSKFLITAQGHNTAEGEREAIQRFHDLRCDGYVLHSRYLSDDELRELAKQPTPFVLLDREVEGLEDRCVTFDHHAASAMAVSRLIDLGHRAIGCISGPHSRYNSLRRKQGYVDTMEQSGLPVLETYIEEGNYGRHSGYVAAETLFKNNPHLTALFSCSEEMTVGALQYLHENGIKVPDQVSVISFDSVDLCEATYPKVSAVHFPISQMARTAVECLMNLTNRIEHSGERHFSAELRIRQADKPI